VVLSPNLSLSHVSCGKVERLGGKYHFLASNIDNANTVLKMNGLL
jgi:hypothetical protein